MKNWFPARGFVSRRSILAAALIAMLVAVSGAAAASGGTSAPKLSESKVRWAGIGGTYEAIIFVAQYQGWFKKEGVTIERVIASGGTAISAALASRSIDMASLGIQELALATERKLGFVGLNNMAKGPTEFGVISDAWAQKTGIKSSSSFADKIRSLRGAKVGLGAPGSTTTTVALLTLRNYGLEPGKDVTTVNLGSGPAQVSAFKQGQIDAFFWIPPLTHTSGGILADFREAPMWNGVNWSGYVTSSDFLRDHPDTVEAFLRATIKAWNYTLKFPEAAAQIAARALPLQAADPVAFKAAFDADYKSWLGGLVFTPKGFQKSLSIASNNTGKAVQATIATATDQSFLLRAAKQVGISVGPYKPAKKN